MLENLRVALVHEWLSSKAGSEQTFLALSELFPEADLFALSHNTLKSFDFNGRSIKTSFLDKLLRGGGRAWALPLMPVASGLLGRAKTFDVVISSSHAFSRAFAVGRSAQHFSYTYTPARYIWYPQLDSDRSRVVPPKSVVLPFRALDRRLARNVSSFAGISSEVNERIRTCYGRESRLIYPPCDVDYFKPSAIAVDRSGALVVSRLVPYKRVDLAIRACSIAKVPLRIVGSGPDERRLRDLASATANSNVEFLGSVTREQLRKEYQRAQVLVFPANEDFGIVPVEAQACGTPVVALQASGSLETVLPGPGSHVPELDVEAFAESIATRLAHTQHVEELVTFVRTFSRERFMREVSEWIGSALC